MKIMLKYLAAVIMSAVAVSTVANEITVDKSTPDKVLLEGKNLDQMFEVAEPSVRMELIIDNHTHTVDVNYTTGDVVLYVDENDAEWSREHLAALASTYERISGREDVKVMVMSDEKPESNTDE